MTEVQRYDVVVVGGGIGGLAQKARVFVGYA